MGNRVVAEGLIKRIAIGLFRVGREHSFILRICLLLQSVGFWQNSLLINNFFIAE